MKVIVHEIATRQLLDQFLHEEPVYGLSVHPATADIFVTAGSDGRLLLYDMR
jgi:WD repeat-containing protein 22